MGRQNQFQALGGLQGGAWLKRKADCFNWENNTGFDLMYDCVLTHTRPEVWAWWWEQCPPESAQGAVWSWVWSSVEVWATCSADSSIVLDIGEFTSCGICTSIAITLCVNKTNKINRWEIMRVMFRNITKSWFHFNNSRIFATMESCRKSSWISTAGEAC